MLASSHSIVRCRRNAVSCTDSLQSTRSIAYGRRRSWRRQGDGASSLRNRWQPAPSRRAHVRDGVPMMCRTGCARRSRSPTARSTPFQRRRHGRTPPQRTSRSTSTSTRCPCARTARSGGGSSPFRSAPRSASSINCIMDTPSAAGATIPPAIVWRRAVIRRGGRSSAAASAPTAATVRGCRSLLTRRSRAATIKTHRSA